MPARPLRPEQVRRTVALVVDDLGLTPDSVARVRRALKSFVDEQMREGDLVAVVRTSSGTGVLQNLTNDRARLHAAIERVRPTSASSGIDDLANITLPSYTIPADNEGNREDFGQRREVFAVGTLGALQDVVAGLGRLPGRKSLVLFSEGFPVSTYNKGEDGGVRLDSRDRVAQAMRRFVEAANRASVVVYPVDARGHVTPTLTAGDELGLIMQTEGQAGVRRRVRNRGLNLAHSRESLSHIAYSTGGLLVTANDLGQAVRRALGEERGYYLIGYRPEEPSADSSAARPRVEVRVKRAGLTVRARTGFYAGARGGSAGSRAARTREEQLKDALLSPFGAGDFEVRLTTLYAQDARRGATLRALVHVGAQDLTFREEAGGVRRAEFDVAAVVYDSEGRVADQVGRAQTTRVGAQEYSEALRSGFVYHLDLYAAKPGAYQVRVAVRDAATGRAGSAAQYAEVPDTRERLALSSVVLAADGDAPSATDPEATPAVRRFARGSALRYSFEVYDARPEKASRRESLTLVVRLFREDRLVFTGERRRLRADDLLSEKRMGVVGRLRLGTELEPGQYLLQVFVTDASSKSKGAAAERRAEFEVK